MSRAGSAGGAADPVRVAVVDSGANAPHPHLPAIAGGVSIALDGALSDDFADRIGHGTATAAAIHEKAPSAELYAVKIFHRRLASTVETLVPAIAWALDHGMRLVNLSLGTENALRAPELGPVIERAVAAGAIVVSAYEHEGRRFYPGSLPGVVGVVADAAHARESATPVELHGRVVVTASPYPRPIPGVPPERNLHGISFAVANVTGLLAAALANRPDVRTAAQAIAVLGGRLGHAR